MTESTPRNELRSKLLGGAHKALTEELTLFGQKIELRQPSMDAVMDAQDQETTVGRAVALIIRYAVVPGTDELIFEPGDEDVIKKWPWSKDITEIQRVILKLTGIDIDAEVKKLQENPTASSSSASPAT